VFRHEVLLVQALVVFGPLFGDRQGLFQFADQFAVTLQLGLAFAQIGFDHRQLRLVFGVLALRQALFLVEHSLGHTRLWRYPWLAAMFQYLEDGFGTQAGEFGVFQRLRGTLVVGTRFGGVQLHQQIPGFDDLSFMHQDAFDGGRLQRLDGFDAIVGDDFAVGDSDDVHLAEHRP
jgi:hypothetical protein